MVLRQIAAVVSVLAAVGCRGSGQTGSPTPVQPDAPAPAPAVIVESEDEMIGVLEPSPEPDVTITLGEGDPFVVALYGIEGCPDPPPPGDAVPQVRASEPRPDYPLDPEVVRRVIRSARDDFERCYAGSTAHAECRNARAWAELVVDGDGKPIRAGARADELELQRCTSNELAKLRFPEPRGGMVVEVRFALEYRVATPP